MVGFCVRFPPVLLCLAAVGLLTVMNGMVKGFTGQYDTLQISFLRYVFGLMWVLPLVLYERPPLPARRNLPIHLARGVLGAISGTTFFYGLGALSMADTFTISFLAPLFVAVLSLLVLREPPRPMDVAALALGFAGVLVVVSGTGADGAPRSLFGVAMVSISAITYALTLVMLRSLAQREAFVWLVLFQHLVSALVLLPFGLSVWDSMSGPHLAQLALAALLGVLGHLMMARAYSRAPAARLAPLEYSALIYAAVIDLIWFGHGLSQGTLIGAAAIIVAALLTSRR